MLVTALREGELALVGKVDLDIAAKARNFWDTYQTRRPELYAPLAHVPAGPPPV